MAQNNETVVIYSEKQKYQYYIDESNGTLKRNAMKGLRSVKPLAKDEEKKEVTAKQIKRIATKKKSKKTDGWIHIGNTVAIGNKINKGSIRIVNPPRKVDTSIYCSCTLQSSKAEIHIDLAEGGGSIISGENNQRIDVNSHVGVLLLTAIANDINQIHIEEKAYLIVKYTRYDAVFVDKFKKAGSQALMSAKECDIDDNQIVYVYYSLNNGCFRNDHELEAVTLVTTDIMTEETIKVNAYYCKTCDRYFIDYAAVRKWEVDRIVPAVKFEVVKTSWLNLKPVSQLMLYGYNVKEGVLSDGQRQNVLMKIMDLGLMSKPEIIVDIQHKIDFNGKKAGNENARQKWKDDQDFVRKYVVDNKRIIRGRLVKDNRKQNKNDK